MPDYYFDEALAKVFSDLSEPQAKRLLEGATVLSAYMPGELIEEVRLKATNGGTRYKEDADKLFEFIAFMDKLNEL